MDRDLYIEQITAVLRVIVGKNNRRNFSERILKQMDCTITKILVLNLIVCLIHAGILLLRLIFYLKNEHSLKVNIQSNTTEYSNFE